MALLCALIAGATWRALLRTGNRAIGFVTSAFVLLSVKNLVKALVLASAVDEGPWLEFTFSLADLVAVALIAWPLLLRRGA